MGIEAQKTEGPPGASDTTYHAGDIIAERYKLVRPLGQGGMGVVWVAESLALDAPVAMKLLHGTLANTKAAERMQREARAAARLGHPAMVRATDFGQTDQGHPFIVMELLHGESLSEMLDEQKRINAVKAVQMLLPIADGLATAHDKGIVHRDLKPDNIFIAKDEHGRVQPKLLDFGIAKDEHRIDTKLTQEGSLMGSPDYMSPEQAWGMNDIDRRSDIWSFCVVLYEAATGDVPFVAPNYNALLRAITNEAPKPITEHAAGDPDLWRILARGLEKNRENRWDSLWELGEALALWLYDQGIREDICANSLKTKWLQAGLSGVQMDMSSEFPPANGTVPPPSSDAPQQRLSREAPPPPSLRMARASPTPGSVPTAERDIPADSFPPKQRRRSVLLGAGAGLIGILAVMGVTLLGKGGAPAQPARSPEPPAVAAPAPIAEAPAVREPEPAPSPQAPAEPAAPVVIELPVQDGKAKTAAKKPAPSTRPAGKTSKPPKKATRDFGF